MSKRGWSFDSLVLIFSIIVIAQLLVYVIPQGEFERQPYPENPDRSIVVPGFLFSLGSFTIGMGEE